MKAIVNVNPNWGIGNKDTLLCHIPEDMKHFKELTINKAIVFGRKTLFTFPNNKPLAHRTNIVLSKSTYGIRIAESAEKNCEYFVKIIAPKNARDKSMRYAIQGSCFNMRSEKNSDPNLIRSTLILLNNIDFLEDIGQLSGHSYDDIIVCGGESIYKQLLPKCDTVYVTKNNYTEIEPDTFFPNLDEMPDEWYIESRGGEMTSSNGIKYEFLTYKRKNNI